jgi:hypothetical protein
VATRFDLTQTIRDQNETISGSRFHQSRRPDQASSVSFEPLKR